MSETKMFAIMTSDKESFRCPLCGAQAHSRYPIDLFRINDDVKPIQVEMVCWACGEQAELGRPLVDVLKEYYRA
jgi:transcription elongation factor Elf1